MINNTFFHDVNSKSIIIFAHRSVPLSASAARTTTIVDGVDVRPYLPMPALPVVHPSAKRVPQIAGSTGLLE